MTDNDKARIQDSLFNVSQRQLILWIFELMSNEQLAALAGKLSIGDIL